MILYMYIYIWTYIGDLHNQVYAADMISTKYRSCQITRHTLELLKYWNKSNKGDQMVTGWELWVTKSIFGSGVIIDIVSSSWFDTLYILYYESVKKYMCKPIHRFNGSINLEIYLPYNIF